MSNLYVTVPSELVDAITERVKEQLRGELAETSPWLTRAQAAAYLSVPVSRLEKDKRVPSHLWDGRRMYHRDELDAWLLAKRDAG